VDWQIHDKTQSDLPKDEGEASIFSDWSNLGENPFCQCYKRENQQILIIIA